jgi:hypothetical protein
MPVNVPITIAPGVSVVLSQGEHGFRRVVDEIHPTSALSIATYNLSYDMISYLETLGPDVAVEIVTNIPNRFDSYLGWGPREKARKAIELYKAWLDPERFSAKVASYFNVNSHAKMVIVDSIAYVGSANFSGASANKYECGFVIEGDAHVAHLKGVFGDLKTASIEHLGGHIDEVLEAAALCRDASESLGNLADEFVDECGEGDHGETIVVRSIFDSRDRLRFVRQAVFEVAQSLSEDLDDELESPRALEIIREGAIRTLAESLFERLEHGSAIMNYIDFNPDAFAANAVSESGAYGEDIDAIADSAASDAADREAELLDLARADAERVRMILSQLSAALDVCVVDLSKAAADDVDNT